MIHPTSNTKAAACNQGKPSTLQTVVTTSKQDQAKSAAETKAATPIKYGLSKFTFKSGGLDSSAGAGQTVAPKQDKSTQNLSKDSKVEGSEKGPGEKNEKKEANDKKSAGTGESRVAYESESDEYSDGSEDGANDEYDDTARPGQSATQYSWL